MNTRLIECRELNQTRKGDGHINGSFEVVLDETNLKLEQGDQVRVGSCFLDTRSDAGGRIEINSSNQNFSINHGFYISNIETNADFTYADDTGQAAVPKPDGKKYVLSYGSVGSTDLLELKSFSFLNTGGSVREFDGTFQITPAHPDGPTTITLHFPSGQGNTVKAQLPENKGTSNFDLSGIVYKTSVGNTSFNQDDFNLIKPTYDELIDKYEMDNPNDQTGTVAGVTINDALFPLSLNFSFTIPIGSYSPDAIAKLITDKMVQYKHNVASRMNFEPDPTDSLVSDYPTRNAYLTSIKQLQDDTAYGIDSGIYTNFYFVSEDNRTALEIDRAAVSNYVVGANQISLEYDPELNKFLWLQNHTNIFNADANPIIKYVASGSDHFLASEYSGIFFQSMNDSTHELLFNQMGFTSSMLATHKTASANKNYDTMLLNTRGFTTDFEIGRNITSNLAAVDASIQKNANFNKVPAFGDLSDITSINLSSIIAGDNEKITQLDEGYFLIQIDGLPNQNIINNPNGKIQQIVSKYYATNDFTIAQGGEGAIAYIHNSPVPETITNLKIRILDPSGSPAEQIGTNNTVFIEIIKNGSN